MSIKAVDFQVILPKTTEVSRSTKEEQQRPQIAQQQTNTTMQNKIDNSLKQVYSQEKTQEVRLKEKQEKEKQEKRRNKGNKNANSGNQTNSIDIRV